MDEYHIRKEQRRKRYQDNLGYIKRKCTACNGSGYYDNHGSPKCSACKGTGKERYKPVIEGNYILNFLNGEL